MAHSTQHPLDSAIERARRAAKHLNDLRQKLAPFLKEGSIVPPNSEIERIQIKLDRRSIVLQVPMIVPILIGEICYNLRTALDYLIYELTKLDTRGTPQYFTQFPIEDCEKKFSGRCKAHPTRGWLQGLNEDHVARIKALQPYMGCDWTKRLQEISNRDKHREFTSQAGAFTVIIYESGEDPEFDTLPLPVQRAKHRRTGADVNVKINMVSRSIGFVDGPPLIETLEELIFNTGETLEAFKTEFQGH